jgi:hypothetical protein
MEHSNSWKKVLQEREMDEVDFIFVLISIIVSEFITFFFLHSLPSSIDESFINV